MENKNGIRLAYLPPDPAVVAEVAGWHHLEWSHFSQRTLTDRIREFDEHLSQEAEPLTVLAWQDSKPVGSASLLVHDMEIHPDWSPWLGSVYVLPSHRERGIGSMLCQQIEQEARRLGKERIYLYTPDRAPFYQRMGWNLLEEIEYKGEQVTLMDKVLVRD